MISSLSLGRCEKINWGKIEMTPHPAFGHPLPKGEGCSLATFQKIPFLSRGERGIESTK